jgi:hypothetical protein
MRGYWENSGDMDYIRIRRCRRNCTEFQVPKSRPLEYRFTRWGSTPAASETLYTRNLSYRHRCGTYECGTYDEKQLT